MWNVNSQPIYAMLYSLIYIAPTIVLILFYKLLKRRNEVSKKTKSILIMICFGWYFAGILGIYITKYYDATASRTEEIILNYGLILFLILQIILTTFLVFSITNSTLIKRVMLSVIPQLIIMIICFISLIIANKYGREVMYTDDTCSGYIDANCQF